MNQQEMKANNKKKIFSAICETPGISRSVIAKQFGYSKTTVSILVDELIQDNYVVDAGLNENAENGQGRKPNSLFLNQNQHRIILINWHKRYIQITSSDISCNIETVLFQELDVVLEDLQSYLTTQVKKCIKTVEQSKTIVAICFILPAMIDEENDEIVSAVLPEHDITNLISNMKDQFNNYPVFFFNDTACLAYGEKIFSCRNKQTDFVYINVNNGIGAAFVLNGNLLGGASGMATQFGHFSLGRFGSKCICGGHGCLETRVGEQALEKRIEECQAADSFKNNKPVLFRDVGVMAEQQDPGALRVMDALAEDMSYALGNLVTMLHVDRVILGGFGCNLGNVFLDRIKRFINGIGFQQFVQNTTIEYTTLDDSFIFGGAARYYLDKCLKF